MNTLKVGSFHFFMEECLPETTTILLEHTPMKTINLPYLSLALGLFLTLVISKGSEISHDGETLLPLLTLLIINECGFFLTAAGAFIGVRQLKALGFKVRSNGFYTITTVLCILLTIQFLLLGIKLWPL